jgi:hypothetical protein
LEMISPKVCQVDFKDSSTALFFGRKIAKRRHCPNFLTKIPFLLKINSPECAPF